MKEKKEKGEERPAGLALWDSDGSDGVRAASVAARFDSVSSMKHSAKHRRHRYSLLSVSLSRH